jgi:hypothetical protein
MEHNREINTRSWNTIEKYVSTSSIYSINTCLPLSFHTYISLYDILYRHVRLLLFTLILLLEYLWDVY